MCVCVQIICESNSESVYYTHQVLIIYSIFPLWEVQRNLEKNIYIKVFLSLRI